MRMLRKAVKIMIASIVIIAAAFAGLYFITSSEIVVARTASQDTSIPRVEIGGAVFHAETFGDPDRQAVIVIHGGPGWDYKSLLSLKALSDEYYVVFYDQRSTGLSPRVSPDGISLESSIVDLASIVDHFGRGRKVDLVGHSWGAMLASAYIGRHPEKVRRAVLAEPGFLTTEMMEEAGVRFGPRWEAGFLYRAGKAWFESLHVKGDADAASDYFLGQIAPYANPEYYCDGVVPDEAADHWRVGSGAMQSIMRSAVDQQGRISINLIVGVERFKDPVLFLASECNKLIGMDHQVKQARFFQDAELVLIKGSGHSIFAERPEDAMRAVRDYLNR